MSAFRFRPQVEVLPDRLNPSALTASPTAPEPVVTIEYLVLATIPSAEHDDVIVDGRIITAESYDSVWLDIGYGVESPRVDDGAGEDILLGARGGDTDQVQDGDDLLIWNNGDGSDFLRGVPLTVRASK